MKIYDDYRNTHKHPINRLTHAFGIPIIVASLLLSPFYFHWALTLFFFGWCLQLTGHIYEGNKPAFFSNPMHLLIGPYWWMRKAIRLDR